MSEGDDPAAIPPLEPDLNPSERAVGDPVPTVDLASVQLLASPHGQEGVVQGLPAVATVAPRAPGTRVEEGAGESERVLKAVKCLGEQLEDRLDSLRMLFEREQRAEAARERVVDRLHAELQDYKQDLLLKVQRPIFIDLIQLHDDIGKMIEARPTDEAGSHGVGDLRGILESIQTAIEDILYRQGVEPFVREGNDFDPRRQRAVSAVPTAEPAMSKTVAARLRRGFQAGEKVIRPEIVTVYALRPTPAAGSQEG